MRATPLVAVALVAAAVATSATAVPVPPGSEPAGLVDGQWVGYLIYDGRTFLAGASGEGAGSGQFSMTISGGAVTEGTSSFQVSLTSTTDAGGGQFTLSGTGTLVGDSLIPVFRITSAGLTGTASAGGVDVPVEIPLTADELNPIPLEVLAVSCEAASGDFSQVIADNVLSAGGSGEFRAYWQAVRTAPGDVTAVEALARLGSDLLSLGDAIASGADPGSTRIAAIGLDVMDQLAAATANEACRELYPGATDWAFSSVASLVRRALELALEHTTTLSTRSLRALVELGVVSGLLLPGRLAESSAADLDILLLTEFAGRYAAAIGPPVATAEMHQILIAALTMGWDDLAAQAREALR